MQKEQSINLLPKEEFARSPLGRSLTWLVTTFRTLVIVVELIVMLAFLSRFYLDAKLTDINEEIDATKSVILSYQAFEQEYRDLQDRLTIYKETKDNSIASDQILESIKKSIPPDTQLSQITISNDSVSILGTSPSERSISQFIVNLENQPTVSGVELLSLSQENEISLNFHMTIKNGS